MKDMNRVFLFGRLGADPAYAESKNGRRYARLRIATGRSYTDANGDEHASTDWHSVFVFGKLAEACLEGLHKGSSVFVEGYLNYWKEEGSSVTKSSIHASSVHFGDWRRPENLDNRAGGGDHNAVAHPA